MLQGRCNFGGTLAVSQKAGTLIVDESGLFREGLRRILQDTRYEVIWCGASLPSGELPAPFAVNADVIVIGAELAVAAPQIASLKSYNPFCRVVLLMDTCSAQDFVAVLRSGADACIPKSISCDALVKSLDLLMEGATVLPSALLSSVVNASAIGEVSVDEAPLPVTRAALAREISLPNQSCGLSHRELRVLECLVGGAPNKSIARDLGITESTVKVHVKSILRKTRVRNRTQVALWATKLGVGATTGLVDGVIGPALEATG
jgi:two-component system, NarL family, nitrate/nitrite response regulator NarL